MRTIAWIIVLFLLAVGLALLGHYYAGDVMVVIGSKMYRANLNTVVIFNLAFLACVYLLFRLIWGVIRVPAALRARKLRQARRSLNISALSFLEGRYQKSLDLSLKALKTEADETNKALALMLVSKSAQETQNITQRDESLIEIKNLPDHLQLARYLFEANLFLNQQEDVQARQMLDEALKLAPNLTQALKLDLVLSDREKQAERVLALVEKLRKVDAITQNEVEQYQVRAFLEQMTALNTTKDIKKWLKNVPDTLQNNQLCVDIAKKYQQLGLDDQAVEWVRAHYPQNHNDELLPVLGKSIAQLQNTEQQKMLEQGESWLKAQPHDAQLLFTLGQIACANQLWGKAQSYYEASIAISPSLESYLTLADLFEQIDKKDLARDEEQKALNFARKNLS
ncbi:heme biosynthesis HemY N-terminal domain-containing protein [Neisseria sp. Ec49-e6-T10]|uniref:heme biosynthesis HemY N-terminal domain-containing protein n=1 Tax=Neisseria sp. Ec49-e6-T10 TaxID=3140744 RepID=UPI003EBDEC41